MCVQNLKFIALRVPEILGGTRKIWAVIAEYSFRLILNFSVRFFITTLSKDKINNE